MADTREAAAAALGVISAGRTIELSAPPWLTSIGATAIAATALSAGGTGAAIGLAHRRSRRRGCGSRSRRRGCGSRGRRRGSGSRRSGGGLRLAASADADEIATALRVPRAVLAFPLTPRTVGPSLTDAKRSQRAPYEGSTHQPEGLTSREGAISQSSSQIVEEAFFSGHRQSLLP
jgi:hypothetical protein